jgi:hypothetical protein
MGQLKIIWEGMKQNTNPLQWVMGDKSLVRSAKSAIEHSDKIIAEQKKCVIRLKKAIVLEGSIAGVQKEFTALCRLTTDELDYYNKGLLKLILAATNEYKRLKDCYKKESDPELKQQMGNDLKELLTYSESWFGKAQGAEGLSIQMSDMASLKTEVSHLLDIFNMQPLSKKVEVSEKRLAKDENRKISRKDKASPKLRAKELNDLKKLTDFFHRYLIYEDTVFNDTIKIMQLEAGRDADVLLDIVKELQKESYPPEALQGIIKLANQTANKLRGQEFETLVDQLNGLIRIIKSIQI